MRTILFLAFFSTFSFALTDLGTYGSTHTIAEENFIDVLNDKAKDLNTTKIREEFVKSESQFLNVQRVVPTCKKTQKRYFTPTFRVPTDVISADGKVIARRGEILNTLEVMKKNNMSLPGYMMFIDAEDIVQVQLSYMYKNQGKVFIVNGDMNRYEKITNIPTSKANKTIVEKFGVTCSPSLVLQQGNKLVIYEYNPKDLKKKK